MKEYTNPIIINSNKGNTSDPFVTRHNGMYYHCYSNKDGVYIGEAENLWGIGTARERLVYDIKKENGLTAWYAPELHFINGKWYIYASPDYGADLHIMTVLEGQDKGPMGEYKNLGVIKGLENEWSIDGTVFKYSDKLYFIWATGYEMQMAEMVSPYEIAKRRITITKPEYDFEKVWGNITEAPAVLKKGDKLHIIYSASDSQCDDYCLGLLTFCGGDILNAENWTKSKKPVFTKTDNIFGPGHCSFTTVTEGEKEAYYIVYHANLESGTGWHGRSVFAQPFMWDKDSMPIFGKPQF